MKSKFNFKQTLALVLVTFMLITLLPLQALAEAGGNYNYEDLSRDKAKIINEKTPVVPVKTDNAAELIKNPDQPAIYTLRTDYKVQRGEKYEVAYQPYIASVGESISENETEKNKVKQEITLPDLAGYDKSQLDDSYTITYDKVKEAADGKGKSGNDTNGIRYQANEDFKYKAKRNAIQIKHIFQDLEDFTKYTNPDGTITNFDGSKGILIKKGESQATEVTDEEVKKHELITTQNGNTGSTMEVSPLDGKHPNRKGFVPEALFITMQVPENGENFVLEYRYNRAHYDVNFDTKGGTPMSNRTLYYEQIIPTIDDKSIPTKEGCDFLGWTPSITLETTGGKTYLENQIIKDSDGKPILNLDADLKMPASKIIFTAVWKDRPKADYAIQFWVEKADHADDASLMDKYDYMGTRVHKDADTGFKPDLDNEPVNGLKFPDLNQARLNKIWAKARFNNGKHLYLNKFFVYNKDLTDSQNGDKTVSATGKTVYNIYYDRQVYDLYFTKSNAQPEKNTFYPEIWGYDEAKGEAVMKGGPGNLYHYKARFNEMMYKWPNDAKQTKGFSPGWQSFGWGPNYTVPSWPLHLDTPPYRLNADEFLDMSNYTNSGGYTKHIDKGDGTTKDLDPFDFKTLSFGIKQDHPSIPHHMDFWMDGFKDGETIIRYDLVRTKADTSDPGYGHRYPKVTGFTPHNYEPGNPQSAWPVIHEGSQEDGRVDEDRIDELNDERDEITPNNCGSYYNNQGIKLPIGQLDFIPVFYSNQDDYGDPKDGGQAFKENGYLQFHYKRNKYPLRFNYDPSIIRDDSYFNSKNQLDTFYEFPLKVLSPDLVADDTERKDKEYFKEDPKNLLDNPNNAYKLGLYDLLQRDKNDPEKFVREKIKVTNEETGEKEEVYTYKFKRPDNLSDQMVFKGWALDPAGTKLIWENPKETMPTHSLNLYAKWGEPDYKWKVTFDPDGGKLKTIKEENLTTELKKIQEGDIGQEEVNTYAKREANDGDKQIFTVIQRQKLVEPKFVPEKKGYDFMGWEVIRYKKNEKGDYTDEIDNSYRKTYKVPELYSFGNDVVSPIYLKAIWVPNQRVDIKVEHYMLDKDYKLVKKLEDKLEDKRAGYLVATTGDRQDDEYILAPHKELEEKLKDYKDSNGKDYKLKTEYDEYNNRVKLNNSFFQTFRVEPEKIVDENGDVVDNPKAANNVFKFFYRPFRQREYTVNYIDERGKAEVEKFFKELELIDTNDLKDDNLLEANQYNKEKFEDKKTDLDKIIKKYQVLDPEAVTNGNRHYDARNYRPIPGWKLTSDPQQQLFFDLNEYTNEFLGINGTGGDQIFFYYKDVRVIEVPNKDDPVPDGYVRVTYKADKGGAFTDKNGNSKTELYYDVIKGLKSDLLPVPQEWVGGKNEDGTEKQKEEGKYYITPETGKKFVKWDEKPLLNKNTIVDNDTKDFYVFTAKFEWSGLTAKGMVRTEAFKDPNSTWTNDFAPTIEDLKKQLEWREKDQVKPLPAGATIKFVYENEDGTEKELNKDKDIFDLVNEQNKADKDQLVRTVNIKAQVTFKDGKEPQELTIPITVYKNVYEALNKEGDKPLFLKEAEGKKAEEGGLSDVTGDYVMVTVQPTEKNTNKDAKVYYVNQKAWVHIPEVEWSQDDKDKHDFLKWTADKKDQNENKEENGIFDFSRRHKFTDEKTLIKPLFSDDVVEQKEGEDKPKVPDTFVKVIVKTTDKATDETAFEKTFWVNPTKEVTIPVANPTGKSDQEVEITGLGNKKVNYIFKEWQKVKTGETDDSLAEVKPAVKIDLAKNQYTDKVTVIEASYKKSILPGKIEEPLKTTKLDTPQGKEITNDDLIKQITPQAGKEIESIEVISKPDGNTVGNEPAKVIVKYKDGTTQGTNDKPVVIPVEVHKNIIPEAPGGQRPKDALDNYVKVIFKAGTGGSLSGDLVYYVSPEVEVDMTESAKAITKTPDVGYISGDWDTSETKKLKDTFKAETEFTFNFKKDKDIVEKIDDPNQVIPEGYVKVTFKTEDEAKGKLEGDKLVKVYYVNPKAGIKLVELSDGQIAGDKQLAVPKTAPAKNYEFETWYEEIDTKTAITSERIHVAKFKLAKVTLTYDAGEGKGTVPKTVEVDHGTKVRLARPDGLSKDNATFAGWKIGETTYQAGDEITLNEDTTATAQWSAAKHTVTFNSMGGTDVASQTVEHGKTATNPEAPTLDGKVFMGWKEKESDTSYFDFNTPITADKTLIAIWQDPVQKINDGDPVEEQFIKVIFNKGKHGTLKLDEQNANLENVNYKVAKDYTFKQAKDNGLVVPKVIADTYYKLLAANEGWDKELKFEGNDAVYTFTAQYAPIADVIPIDPDKKDQEIDDERPDNMVVVRFTVDEDKAYMEGITKYYVKKNIEVEVPSPIVFNKISDNEFKGWVFNNEVTMKIKGSFSKDTVISDKVLEKATIHIEVPTAGADLVKIEDITDGAKAKLEVISNGQSKVYDDSTVTVRVRQGRKFTNVKIHGFKLDKPLQSGDLINFWAINDNGESEVYKYIIE